MNNLFLRRKVYYKAGLITFLAGYFDASLMVGNDPVTNAESEPGPLANRFGGEKRVKDLVQALLVYSIPIIPE